MAERGRIGRTARAAFTPVEEALAEISSGNMVIVVDDPDRENEGDLVIAGEKVTAEAVNFMATHGRGLVCVPMLKERLDALEIPPMVESNSDPHGTAFHVGVDHVRSTTGISAGDRAETIRALADDTSVSETFTRPGHVFPLAYRPGGVLRRAGHTEAAVDLARLAGCKPVGVICEIANRDGTMAKLDDLMSFAAEHQLPIISIADLISWRRQRERSVERISEASLPLAQGNFRLVGYRDHINGCEHVALILGNVARQEGILVRMHSECLTGDVFGSRRCDCGRQLQLALDMIGREGRGVLVYLRGHEGRGIGILNKIHAYRLQDMGFDTVDANLELGLPIDRRDYGAGMHILRDLGVDNLRLLTNNPAKRAGLEGYGLTLSDRVPLVTDPTPENAAYLATKQARLGHTLAEGVESKHVPTAVGQQ